MNRLISSLVLIFLLTPVKAFAAEALQGEIRLMRASEGAAWIGQETEINLELWSNGFSFADQLFQLPEVKGGFLLQADSSTVKLSENREDGQWLGLRYTLLFYPQRAGRLIVPAFEVRFSAAAGYGTQATAFEFSTEPLSVETRLPPGADSSGLIVTSTSFAMESSWRPHRSGDEGSLALQVGDALTLEVNRRADDVPGMVFDPLPKMAIDGLAVYPGTPRVDDRVNRGSLTGQRNDTITFVCERKGRFIIPELKFQWWDPERERLEEKIIPSLTLEVTANPAFAGASASSGGGEGRVFSWPAFILALLLVLLLLFPGRIVLRRMAEFLQTRRAQKAAGEPWAWKQVERACKRGLADQAYPAISLWLSRSGLPGGEITLLQLAENQGDKGLGNEAIELQEQLISGSGLDSGGQWNGRELVSRLKRYRDRAGMGSPQVQSLSPLNPGWTRKPTQ